MKTDKKIINLSSYANILNSPLLQKSKVEIKDYSKSLNTLTKIDETTSAPEPEKQTLQTEPQVEQKTQQPEPEKKQWEDYTYNAPTEPPLPDDNIREMSVGEEPEKPTPDDSDLMSPTEAKTQAEMIINMYSAFVPPALGKMLKKDVGRVKAVMTHNGVPLAEIQKLERFLNMKNSEIAKALHFTKEQVSMLKQAISAVLERYKISPDNPVINLIIIVFGIAVTQFMTVTAIINAQFEQLKEIIEARNLTTPEGYEDFATPQGLFRKKNKIKKAA